MSHELIYELRWVSYLLFALAVFSLSVYMRRRAMVMATAEDNSMKEVAVPTGFLVRTIALVLGSLCLVVFPLVMYVVMALQ